MGPQRKGRRRGVGKKGISRVLHSKKGVRMIDRNKIIRSRPELRRGYDLIPPTVDGLDRVRSGSGKSRFTMARCRT